MIVAALTCAAMVVALVLLLRKLNSPGSSLPLTADWIEELSIERYQPMMRLLDCDDLEFLRSQLGFTPVSAGRLRAQRCRAVRGFLRSLTADFDRVSTALNIVMLHSGRDRSDLASVLVNQQLSFTCGLMMVHVRLLLYRWGICTVDVTSVVKIFDRTRRELQSMVPAAQPMGA
jgi:hypothetical protein